MQNLMEPCGLATPLHQIVIKIQYICMYIYLLQTGHIMHILSPLNSQRMHILCPVCQGYNPGGQLQYKDARMCVSGV